MTKISLIIAAIVVALAGVTIGGIFFLRPEFILGAQAPAASHGVPSYAQDGSEADQARRHALRLVEQLGGVQDRIIRGDRDALLEQQQLLSNIAREVRGFSRDQWTDYVNVRTSLLYVLSGGNANVLKPLLEQKLLATADERLATGIMNFAEGHTKVARELFDDIDPRSLDVSLVGPFALAKASLYLEDDHDRAIRLLDDARLAGPHTAIDEASARREIPLLLELGNTPRAMMLTTSYVREFGRSIYAWKLFRDFAEAASKREELDSAETVERLANSFAASDQQAASELFIDLAGEGLIQGRLKLAKAAAAEVLKFNNISPENLEKAKLYAAAAAAPSNDARSSLSALDQITIDRLSEEDIEIREVAGFIAKTVINAASDPSGNVSPSATVGDGKLLMSEAQGPSAKNAATALTKADAILQEAESMIARNRK